MSSQTPCRPELISPPPRLALRVALGLTAAVTAASTVLSCASGEPTVPVFADVRAAHRPSDVQFLDRHGTVVHELRVDPAHRRLAWVPLSAVSPTVPAAVLVAEDRRFHDHAGVDWRAMAGVALDRMRGRPIRGASTITMQLAGLLAPSAGRGTRTLRQKWHQVQTAGAIEATWTKDQILEAYLNLVTYRGEVQGIGAAAAVLFAKAPHGLTRAEAATLAALLAAPNAGADTVGRRARRISAAVTAETGASADEAVTAAVSAALHASGVAGPRTTLAPHAARRIPLPARHDVAIPTTLDAGLQQAATEILRRHLLSIRDRNVHDGAVIVVDNRSGEVRAYAGSSGPLSTAPHVDAVVARRQPGSTLKPFLYALAIDQRLLTAASRLDDTPLEVVLAGAVYRPRNYDEEFRGAVSTRTALASSLNVPAVRALQLIGADAFVGHLRYLGLHGLAHSGEYYGPALALGSGEASLWELAGAYRTLATGGVWSPLRLTPTDAVMSPARVYSAAAAYVIADILADRQSRSWTFGLDSPLDSRVWAAVKTGTSKDMRDNWCIGFSREVTVGVWVGNASGRAMHDVSGVTGAAPVWAEVMAYVHRDHRSPAPEAPSELVRMWTGFDAGVEPSRLEWFLAGTEPPEPAPAIPANVRITTPADGAVIAIDPDIPADRQRLAFAAAGGLDDVEWVLDSTAIGPARPLDLWPVQPGVHRLALVASGDRVLDAVRFRVRHSRTR